jgi:hypothetical protein
MPASKLNPGIALLVAEGLLSPPPHDMSDNEHIVAMNARRHIL